jgi:uncharacterized protein YbjQ (UPF0145 family)
MNTGSGLGMRRNAAMIVTTTNNIEGKQVVEYKGIVFGEVIAGVDFVKDFVAGLSNFFGGRSNAYEEELMRAREAAIQELQQRAAVLGADAVIGIDVDYEVLGSNNGMLMVNVSGTAVTLRDI